MRHDDGMLELRLRSGDVLAFDGRVLELFGDGASFRFHVARVTIPRLVADSGEPHLVFDDPPFAVELAREDLPGCRRLVAAIEQAKARDAEPGHWQPSASAAGIRTNTERRPAAD